MWLTPVGAEFRSFINDWEESQIREEKYNQIKLLLDGQNFTLFFEYEDDVYGATEQHRVTFSRIKSPDEETSEDWIEEAHFLAFNLSESIKGKPVQEIFYEKDVKKIDVITKEKAFKKLKEKAEEASTQKVVSGAKTILQALQKAKEKKEPGIKLNQDKNEVTVFRGTGPEGVENMRPSNTGVYGPGIYFHNNLKDASVYAEPNGGVIEAEIDENDPEVKVIEKPKYMVGSNVQIGTEKIIVVPDSSKVTVKRVIPTQET